CLSPTGAHACPRRPLPHLAAGVACFTLQRSRRLWPGRPCIEPIIRPGVDRVMSSSRYGLLAKACHAGLGKGMPGKTSHGGGRGMSVALSYSSGESATPLLGDTIGGNFDATVRAFGDREALVDRTPADGAARRWTYAELAADVDALALGLLEMGIVKGDRVGIWAPNCAEWTLTQYATAKIGAILVNINPAYRTRELEFVLNQSGSTLLVAAERLKTSDYAAMIAAVRSPPSSSTPTTRSTSSTPRAPPASRRARRCRTTTSSTTRSSSASCATTPRPTGSASRCRATTASAWAWAICRRPATARAWSSPHRPSTPPRPCRPCRLNAAPRCTACPPCSSPSCPSPALPTTTCPACAPASWQARRARSR